MGVMSNRGVSNVNYNQFEPLLSVKKLKDTYLFGVRAVDHEGKELSDDAVQQFINAAISALEHDLDIAIMPRAAEEHKDYYANDYNDFGYMSLNRYPVISVESIKMVYQRDANNLETVLEIPQNWVRLDPDTGIIRLIASSQYPARMQFGSSGSFFPEIFKNSMVPNMWVVNYTHGFKQGCVPTIVNSAIGLLAANYFLIIAGDLILSSAGISGQSISLDGLSQSINTTASAENNGFSGRIRDNNSQLFGDRTRGTQGIIDAIRRFYKGSSIAIL
jgi:hypothetical protein